MSRGLIDRVLQKLVDHDYVGYGTGVDISGYTSNAYTVPSNGIIRATARYYAGSYASVQEGASVIVGVASPTSQNGSSNSVGTAVVFKGQKVTVSHSSSNYGIYFYPFINSRGGGRKLPIFAAFTPHREAVAA